MWVKLFSVSIDERILQSIQYYSVLFPDPLSKSLISDFEKEMRHNQANYVFKSLVFFLSINASTIRFIMVFALFSSQNNTFTEKATL